MKTYKNCLQSLKTPLLIISMVLVFFFGFNIVSAADASQVYVSPAGNDTWNGQATTYISADIGPKKTIKNAVNIVNTGGIVNVASGTYYENNIVLQKDLTIKGADIAKTIINANQKGKIFTVDPNVHVTIANIKLINGRNSSGGAIENEGSLSIVKTGFSNNVASNFGGAILNYYGSLNVSYSYFSSNGAVKQGGAIYNTHGNMWISNSNFINNKDDIGGAVCNYHGNSYMKYLLFEANSASSYGGALANIGTSTVYNCTFKNNKANNSGGAIINQKGSILSMKNSYLTGNTAKKYGGSVYNLGKASLTNNYYSHNTGFEGACIFSCGNLYVDRSTFENNKAYSVAGAVDNYHGISKLYNSSFMYNYSKIFGGAVYNDNQCSSDVKYSTITIQNCNFTGNIAYKSGGAIHNNHGTVNVSKSKFIKNSSTHYGGAITNYCGIYRQSYSSLSNNKAGTYGGAVYNTGYVNINTNSFLSNSANIGGGAILNNHGTISLYTSKFTNNKAKTRGGAIYNIPGKFTQRKNTFINNTACNYSCRNIYNYYG